MIYLDVFMIDTDGEEENLEIADYVCLGEYLADSGCDLTVVYFTTYNKKDPPNFVVIPSFEEYTYDIELALSLFKLKCHSKIVRYTDVDKLVEQAYGDKYSDLKKATFAEHMAEFA